MVTALGATQSDVRPGRRRLSAFLPLSSGSGEILALDGLRAIAALSVMIFHSYHSVRQRVVVAGLDISFLWNYGQSGVHLFFVLSGFLLFMPFARAMLNGRPLPSVKRFFQRRALRILPAYYVCLLILSAVHFRQFASPKGLATIGVHLFMLHDDVASMNRAINGPFWTLAIEAQFYVVLPVFAWAISRFVGATRSRWRVVIGVLAVAGGALALRTIDLVAQVHFEPIPGVAGAAAKLFVHATLGAQGKYLEVFALGMLCSVLYLAAQEESRQLRRRLPWIGATLVTVALVTTVGLAHLQLRMDILTPPIFTPPPLIVTYPTDLLVICGPFLAGLPYAALTLGVLWAPRWLRAIFELGPLRFIGLISYSLYLWHLPILLFATRYALELPADFRIGFEILVGFVVAVPVAYLSYQFVERPFLARRRRIATQAA